MKVDDVGPGFTLGRSRATGPVHLFVYGPGQGDASLCGRALFTQEHLAYASDYVCTYCGRQASVVG